MQEREKERNINKWYLELVSILKQTKQTHPKTLQVKIAKSLKIFPISMAS